MTKRSVQQIDITQQNKSKYQKQQQQQRQQNQPKLGKNTTPNFSSLLTETMLSQQIGTNSQSSFPLLGNSIGQLALSNVGNMNGGQPATMVQNVAGLSNQMFQLNPMFPMTNVVSSGGSVIPLTLTNNFLQSIVGPAETQVMSTIPTNNGAGNVNPFVVMPPAEMQKLHEYQNVQALQNLVLQQLQTAQQMSTFQPASMQPLPLLKRKISDTSDARFSLASTSAVSTSSMNSGTQDPMVPYKPKRTRRRRTCTHTGCMKLAQGRSTCCFAHGGGYRCQHTGCQSGARGCTSFCIKHGGGLRCTFPGCKSSARGKKRLCISHGGGKRCTQGGCDKAAQGATMYCKRHLKAQQL